MNSVLQSDIFFFISSISTVLITLAILIALFLIVKILSDIRGVLKVVRRSTNALSEDFSLVRNKLRDRGVLTGFMLSLFTMVIDFVQKTKERRSQKNKK